MIVSSRGGYSSRRAVVCLVLCVYVAATEAYTVYVFNPQAYDPEAIGARQSYVEAEDLSRDGDYQSRLIPIKTPRVDKQLVALPLEPEAEMLPAHYTGVKPPGVDHMELKYAESQVSKVDPTHQSSRSSSQRGGTRQRSGSVHEVQRQKAASFEKARKGDRRKEHRTSESVENGGQKKSRSKENDSSEHDEATAGGKAGNSHQKKKSGYLNSKAGGYRNLYHKDEFKRDHDFYDNDDEGGHLKKHGRYKEKHVAREGTYKNGASRNAGVGGAETGKKGAKKNSRAEQESEGRAAGRGYDGFFKNFQGFAKQIGQADGGKFGFVEAKER
ncbi:uncharacterized protein LOC117224551 [Megalopta genalis]|uniref:uncharacterized protein LOC117224551 n=1 Tax=Megalopta genalis TaxID=115081 RepID=UPI003FD146D6